MRASLHGGEVKKSGLTTSQCTYPTHPASSPPPPSRTRDDHGGIAFMRPGSTGTLSGNLFQSPAGCPPLNDAHDPGLPGWAQANNVIDGQNGVFHVAATPILTARPAANGASLTITATSSTPGAVLRYTTDGSRPRATSAILPPEGLVLGDGHSSSAWRATAVFVKAFAAGGSGVGQVIEVESESAGGVFAPPS